MGDDDIVRLTNTCGDLVTLAKSEAFPLYLLRCKAGEWHRVRDICRDIELNGVELHEDLFATWLPDPMSDETYSLIVFYDVESMWSSAAPYNRQRILGKPAPEEQPGKISKSA